MTLLRTVQVALIIPLCASAVDVSTINVSCSVIQTNDGFQFKYDDLPGVEIMVHHGEAKIGSLEIGKQPKLSPEVIWMDNKSVITKECRDLWIQVFTVDDDQHMSEYRLYFNITVDSYNPVTPGSQVNETPFIQENTTKPVLPTPGSQTDYTVWTVSAVVPLIVVFVIIGVILYLYWRRKMRRRREAATICEFFRYLCSCNALKNCISTKAESSETQETRPLSGMEMRGNLTTEIQQNGISLATDPSGSGENGVAQDSPHGSVHVVSTHPQCNGASLDHKLGNEEFKQTANGDLNIPDVDRASHHGDMNSVRNMRDDPGGSNGDVSVDIPDSDVTAEAEPLVNKDGYDQEHQVIRCSATPEPDVESTPRVKNSGIY